MGADYVGAELWCETGKPLDWKAGHDRIDTLVFEFRQGSEDTFVDELIADEDLLEWANNEFDFDEDLIVDGVPITDERFAELVRPGLHKLLTETAESLGLRDVTTDVLDVATVYRTGGMSWGDTPTESCGLWWKWSNDDGPFTLWSVMEAVGFVGALGWPDSPFEVVRKDREQ